MAIISHKRRIVFFPIEKNCSTSVKHLFYRLETGTPFPKAKKKFNLVGHVHNYYPSFVEEKWLEFYDAYDTIAIVRDPIKRFLSAYGNRVVATKALETVGHSKAKIDRSVYSLQPSLDEFVQNLEFYCEVSPYIERHIASQSSKIGKFFSKIKLTYDTSQIPEFEEYLSKKYRRKVKLPHKQTAGPKYKISDLKKESLEKLQKFYEKDYNMLSNFYNSA